MDELDQKIADIKATLRSVQDLSDVVTKLLGNDAYVSIGKTRAITIDTQCFADEKYDIVLASTNGYLNGEE